MSIPEYAKSHRCLTCTWFSFDSPIRLMSTQGICEAEYLVKNMCDGPCMKYRSKWALRKFKGSE